MILLLRLYYKINCALDKIRARSAKSIIRSGQNFTLRNPNNLVFPENIIVGSNVFINSGLTALAYGRILIESETMLGPNVSILTSGHDPDCCGIENHEKHILMEVIIKRGCWIGASSILLPGIIIGENTTIGAGSVVTKDIPPNVVAVGNPCRVLRKKVNERRE